MLPEFKIEDSAVTGWSETSKANLLPGGLEHSVQGEHISARSVQYRRGLFSIFHRVIKFFKTATLTINENQKGIRLEAVLSGELNIIDSEQEVIIKPGQYQLSKNPEAKALFKSNSACNYFITHYSDELLKEIGIKDLVIPSPVKPLTDEMRDLIQKILHNPFEDKLRDFYYDNCIRELMRMHLTNRHDPLPGKLTDADLAAIYAADAIIQQDLQLHYDIKTLSRKVGVNQKVLKFGFRDKFNMGVFERLTYHRLEKAKLLLRTTRKTMDQIAVLVGYETRNSFITAFRKKVAITPKKWKMKMIKGD